MRYEFGGLIFGGAYFRNFTVTSISSFGEICISLNVKYMDLSSEAS